MISAVAACPGRPRRNPRFDEWLRCRAGDHLQRDPAVVLGGSGAGVIDHLAGRTVPPARSLERHSGWRAPPWMRRRGARGRRRRGRGRPACGEKGGTERCAHARAEQRSTTEARTSARSRAPRSSMAFVPSTVDSRRNIAVLSGCVSRCRWRRSISVSCRHAGDTPWEVRAASAEARSALGGPSFARSCSCRAALIVLRRAPADHRRDRHEPLPHRAAQGRPRPVCRPAELLPHRGRPRASLASIPRTVLFALGSTIVTLPLAMATALVLNGRFRGVDACRRHRSAPVGGRRRS